MKRYSPELSSDLSAEGCERLIESVVDRKYGVQFGPAKHLSDTLTRRNQFEIAAPSFGRDVKSYKDTDSPAVNVIYTAEVNHNLRRPHENALDSFAERGTFIANYNTTTATKNSYVIR